MSGLYLEGAAWDLAAGRLRRQAPRQTVEEMPLLQVTPVEAGRARPAAGCGSVRVPVYVTQSRRSTMGVGLVMEAHLATDEHCSHWVLQGTALVLNTDR